MNEAEKQLEETVVSSLTFGNNALEAEYDEPINWTLYVHPQGWVYFFNPVLKVVTDQDVRKPTMLLMIERASYRYPLELLKDGMEIQMSVQSYAESSGEYGLNLAINHSHCVASYNLDDILDQNIHLLSQKNLNRKRRLYWNYLWNHPSHVSTPSRAITDAIDALTWFQTDNLISGSRSIVPFSKSECEDLSRLVRDLSLPLSDNSVAKTTFLSWLLREVCSFRDAEYYGQHTLKEAQALRKARLPHPAISNSNPPTMALPLINVIINFLFFGIPHSYYAHVKNTSEYRGRLANVQQKWENYIERLVREYSDFLLISTVLLSATVGFLAVPNISEGAKVAVTISALNSLGSIIIGVFSIWRHQTNTGTANSFTYMHNAQHSYLGYHGHALLLSLPPTLLIWAIIFFTMAIVVFVLQGISDADIWAQISAWTMFSVFILILVIVIAALHTFSVIWKFQQQSFRIWLRLRWPWFRKPYMWAHA